MPNKEGLETIRELKERHPDARVIACTGGGRLPHLSGELLDYAEILGADHVMEKPVNPNALLGMVKDLLERAIRLPAMAAP
ncbi:MAG: hypothetical protein HQL36_11755, partial [Alphaproteobacteria bacterium]|nr:hypothetical protein [Alphaproteobacteria bacterium]